jgi:D-glycero-beta-D-manno-heptose-7-phosphate kinase
MTMAAERARLVKFIERFPKTRILVVGDVVLDHYVWGKVTRISPEAPVPVVNVTHENHLLGGAANVVQNIHALGGRVSICGVIGQDEAGVQVLDLLKAQDIPLTGLVREQERPTTIKTRVIAHHQQVVRFDRETKERISKDAYERIYAHIRQSIADGLEGIVISDYCKGVVTAELVREIVRLARKHGVVVSVDPKVNHFGMYHGVSILTPNVQEASIGAKIEIVDEATLLKAGAILLKQLNSAAVLITRGEQGMSLFEHRGKVTHIPTMAREVFDVTGAGDTVIAALTLAMASGAAAVDAACIANYAAGIVVGVVGTATVKAVELRKRITRG